jgi:signal transduction histidine kinase
VVDSDTTVYVWEADQLLVGRPIIVGRQRIGGVSVGLSTLPLQTKISAAQTQGIVLGAAAAAIGALLSLILSRSIIQPLEALTAATRSITAGDLSQRLTVHGGDELAILASGFNTMSDRLRDTIASLKQQAIELQAANEKVSESSRLKSEFLSTMSHELRTPLNAIIGFSGIMLEGMSGQIDSTAQYMVEAIYNSSQHLLSLINNVLDLSKIEAGRLEIVSAPLDTREVIDQWKMQMDILAKQKGLRFEVQVDPTLPNILYGDRERISQITINLLSNAFKFTDHGDVFLNVGWQDKVLIIRVTDTGIGIPPNALDYIFEEFRQVDGSSQRSQNGTGLGLPIVRKLCKAMGGNVLVNSKLGAGSVFTVMLPMALPVKTEPVPEQG